MQPDSPRAQSAPQNFKDDQWIPVDGRLATVQHVNNLIWTGIIVLIPALPWLLGPLLGLWDSPTWLVIVGLIIAAADLLAGAIEAIIIPRRVRNMAWMLRSDEFAFRRGILIRREVVVPYGRLQYVDVKSGPLLRWKGLCGVSFHTAAAEASPDLPGLVQADGDWLRDELAARGEKQLAGL